MVLLTSGECVLVYVTHLELFSIAWWPYSLTWWGSVSRYLWMTLQFLEILLITVWNIYFRCYNCVSNKIWYLIGRNVILWLNRVKCWDIGSPYWILRSTKAKIQMIERLHHQLQLKRSEAFWDMHGSIGGSSKIFQKLQSFFVAY